MKMEFVKVQRVEQGDYMVIPKQVQEQYPKKFIVVVEEEEPEVIIETPKKRGRKVNS